MNDKRIEELSAMMDGEASDLEVRRLLKQMEEDSELVEAWDRFHRTRHVLRDEQDLDLSLDISARVAAAIDAETSPTLESNMPLSSKQQHTLWQKWMAPVAQTAVAASVAVSVMIGYQSMQVADQTTAKDEPQQLVYHPNFNPTRSQLSNASPVSSGLERVSATNYRSQMAQQEPIVVSVPPIQSYQLVKSGAAVQLTGVTDANVKEASPRSVEQYLMTHAGNAAVNTNQGMMPFARVVSMPLDDQ